MAVPNQLRCCQSKCRFSSSLLLAIDSYPSGKSRLTSWRLLFYSLQVLELVRLLVASYAFHTGWQQYFQLDIFLAAASQIRLFDHIMALLTVPMSLYLFYLDYLVYFRLGKEVLQMAIQLVVLNSRQFFQLNPKLRMASFDCVKPAKSTRVRCRQLVGVWNVCRKVKFHCKLTQFPILRPRDRVRILLASDFMESVTAFSLCLNCKFHPFICHLGTHTDSGIFPFQYWFYRLVYCCT